MSLEYSPTERFHAWEDLENSIAWKEFVDTVRAQKAARETVILREAITPDNIYDRERIRGEWAGLELVLEYAATLKEVAQQDYETQLKERENETEV